MKMRLQSTQVTANENNSALDTTITIPWQPGLELGSGIAAVSAKQRKRAVEPIDKGDENRTKNVMTGLMLVQTAEDVAELIDLSAKLSFDVHQIQGDLVTKFVNKVRVSRQRCSIVARQSIVYAPQIKGPYKLTDEAAQEKAAEAFRRTYGDYFVAGQIKAADFVAVYDCEALSQDNLTEFTTEVGVLTGKFDATTAATLAASASKFKVRVNCTVLQRGVANDAQAEVSLDPQDVPKLLNQFAKDAVGEPQMAVLWHYSLVGGVLKPVMDIPPSVMVNLADLHVKLCSSQVMINSCPPLYKVKLSDEYNKIKTAVEAASDALLDEKDPKLIELLGQLNDWQQHVRLIFDYEKIFNRCKEIKANTDSEGEENGTKWRWDAGVIAYEDNPDVEIEKWEKPLQVSGAFMQSQELDCIFPEKENGRKIVGYQVQANWRDGTCGKWERVDGGLLTNTLRIKTKSQWARGMNWTVRVYHVDSKKMRFDD
ncbi:MAG: hypothetical protein MUF81_13595 [Verrucomicrobia bacterium]|jgi:hypothetical protein|nr:hypothetical protein [Verrucomicrobiota bacterium]